MLDDVLRPFEIENIENNRSNVLLWCRGPVDFTDHFDQSHAITRLLFDAGKCLRQLFCHFCRRLGQLLLGDLHRHQFLILER